MSQTSRERVRSADPALRADAARNRERIVEAACRLFQEHGLDAPLEDVAREAGVGIATLYRRFPTRGDLTAAVYERIMSDYSATVERAAAQPDPWEGLSALVIGLCELQASNAALRDLVTMRGPESIDPERQSLTQGRLEALVTRAQEAGRLRPDVEVTDLVLVLLGNAEIVKRTAGQGSVAWRRYAALQLEALRSRPDPAALPPAASAELSRGALERTTRHG
ncbi:helix-turn-helix domain containing protein [Nocardioides sp. CER19]|uniref:TetR/AcrR family transcriptional regulator n=1 Tax=Nocardioides sp. CER19 TaxID=3038538 RepID=UPI0024499CF2|nr:helix-turn-helix domain containing protein [Nocardioides sp. CER19]MDH2413981.1 helix-turn-helix domain containing protein [Nocardioides sp. CER19]